LEIDGKESLKNFQKIAVVGGAGHVGAPLALVLARKGHRVVIHDINCASMEKMARGTMPFLEKDGTSLLRRVLKSGRLEFSDRPESISGAQSVILTLGTPIDEFHNPVTSPLINCINVLLPHIRKGGLMILRSTVAPGTTAVLERHLRRSRRDVHLAFCPERVVQGRAIEEIAKLPQIISGSSDRAVKAARRIFSGITSKVVVMSLREAEYAKLICNAYRYIQFAATNQLYMMVESAGINYHRLLAGMKNGYARMASVPRAGFAAGPCLMKDTMQLFAFEKHNFVLGQIAMNINEGLPEFLVSRILSKEKIINRKVGILGMAFKAQSDDIRQSLSYKLKKVLEFAGAKVLCSDPYVKGSDIVPLRELIKRASIIIVGVPHRQYRLLKMPPDIQIIDPWGFLRQ